MTLAEDKTTLAMLTRWFSIPEWVDKDKDAWSMCGILRGQAVQVIKTLPDNEERRECLKAFRDAWFWYLEGIHKEKALIASSGQG